MMILEDLPLAYMEFMEMKEIIKLEVYGYGEGMKFLKKLKKMIILNI